MKERKTGKRKKFPINAHLQTIVQEYTDGMKPDEYLFASRNGSKPITRGQAHKIISNAADMIGLERISTHSLRKTFGYHLYRRTKDVALLQEMFNHSHPSITLRYIGIAQDNVDKALEDFIL